MNYAFLNLLEIESGLFRETTISRRFSTSILENSSFVSFAYENERLSRDRRQSPLLNLYTNIVGLHISSLIKVIQLVFPDNSSIERLKDVCTNSSIPGSRINSNELNNDICNNGITSSSSTDSNSSLVFNVESKYKVKYVNIDEMICKAINCKEEVLLQDIAKLECNKILDDFELSRINIDKMIELYKEDAEYSKNIGYLVRRNGKLLPIAVSVRPLRQILPSSPNLSINNENKSNGSIIVFKDLTEDLKSRIAKKKLADKSKWISVIVHEMRTPVHGVIGNK